MYVGCICQLTLQKTSDSSLWTHTHTHTHTHTGKHTNVSKSLKAPKTKYVALKGNFFFRLCLVFFIFLTMHNFALAIKPKNIIIYICKLYYCISKYLNLVGLN